MQGEGEINFQNKFVYVDVYIGCMYAYWHIHKFYQCTQTNTQMHATDWINTRKSLCKRWSLICKMLSAKTFYDQVCVSLEFNEYITSSFYNLKHLCKSTDRILRMKFISESFSAINFSYGKCLNFVVNMVKHFKHICWNHSFVSLAACRVALLCNKMTPKCK